MLVAINIGNTNTGFGVFQEEILKGRDYAATLRQSGGDEIRGQMERFLAGTGFKANEIEGAGISSVVPGLTAEYAAVVRSHFGFDPLIVNSSLDLGIRIHYADPEALGADRLCSAVAGYAKYGGPLIIIDFGTATTYNVIAANGDFLGGVIGPGIGTSAMSLHTRTAQLPKVELQLPRKVIGDDTTGSMQSGILRGAIDATIGMIKRIRDELKERESKSAAVIATGGFSEFMGKQIDAIQYVEPSLVLEGIRLIYDRVHRAEKSGK